VFYALTYVGFAYPIALAELSRSTSFTVLLLCLAGVVVVCLAVVASYSRKPLRHE